MNSSPDSSQIIRWLFPAVAVLSAALALFTMNPSRSAPADADPQSFSAGRALQHVQAVAASPRPMGTAEHGQVRDYLVAQLKALGAEPRVQEAVGSAHVQGPWFRAGRVRNVLARFAGREQGPALLLTAHYDTVPSSPGAADDGAGIAAILEVLRVLGPQPERDVIVLFSDGEEAGLLGARAFLDQHPWAADVGAVINLEARGTEGPALMFETSPGNQPLISTLRRSGASALATSASWEIYRRLPNDTDFTVYRRNGLPGFNFAFIRGATAYDTAQDTVDRLDPASLQNLGEAVLDLSRSVLAGDLADLTPGSDNAIFFNLLGTSALVAYPASLALPLALLALVLWVLVARRQRKNGAGSLTVGLMMQLLVGLGVAVVFFVLRGVLMGNGYDFRFMGGTSRGFVHLGVVLSAVGFGLWAHARLLGRAETTHRSAGLLLWCLLAIATSLQAPGLSYLFVLPLLAALIARLVAGERDAAQSPVAVIAAVGALVLTVLLWAPFLSLVSVGMPFLAPPILALMTVWLLGGPLSGLAPSDGSRKWFGLLVVVGLLLIVGARLMPGHGEENRLPTSLYYAHDHEAGSASWYSVDPRPDAWTREILGASPEQAMRPDFLGWPLPVWRASAPASIRPAANVVAMGEGTQDGGQRWVEVEVRWPFPMPRAILTVQAEGGVHGLAVDGATLSVAGGADGDLGAAGVDGRVAVVHHAPANRIQLRVELGADADLTVEAVAQTYGLPALQGIQVPPRPDATMPAPGWTSDSAFVRSLHTLAPGEGLQSSEAPTLDEAVEPPSENEPTNPPDSSPDGD